MYKSRKQAVPAVEAKIPKYAMNHHILPGRDHHMGNATNTPGRGYPHPKVYQILLALGCIPRKEYKLMNGENMRYEDSLAWLPHSKTGCASLRGCFACVDQ